MKKTILAYLLTISIFTCKKEVKKIESKPIDISSTKQKTIQNGQHQRKSRQIQKHQR